MGRGDSWVEGRRGGSEAGEGVRVGTRDGIRSEQLRVGGEVTAVREEPSERAMRGEVGK